MSRKKPQAKLFLHYDPEQTYFTVSNEELDQLTRNHFPLSKEVFLVSLPLALSTSINAIAEIKSQQTFEPTLPMFLNSVASLVSAACSIIAAIAWYRNSRTTRSTLEAIRGKPKIELSPDFFDVGLIPPRAERSTTETSPSILPSPDAVPHSPETSEQTRDSEAGPGRSQE